MIKTKRAILLETGVVCLAALYGAAVSHADEGKETHGKAEIGVGNVALDEPGSKYGEYSGIGEDDTYLVGEVEASIEDGLSYLDLQTTNIGLDSRSLNIAAGKYGIYSLAFSYNETPHLISGNDRTPFDGAGGDRLTLPGGFVQGATTADMTSLEQSLQTLDLRTDRTENLFRLTRSFAAGWQVKLSLAREDKNGLQSLGALTAQNAGQADSTILPQPVDYRTEDFSAALAFNGDGHQLELGYFLSMFHNGNSSITWDVPFLKASPAALDYPTVARIGLPPDNKYQRVSFNGGINLPRSTRLSAVVELGRMSQDDVFLPYSTDDIGGTAVVKEDGDALPRSSADVEVDVMHATLRLASQPLPRLGVNAYYRYYETENKTPYALFDRVINDTVSQSSTEDIYSRPYDYARSKFDIGANYRFQDGLRLKTEIGREMTDYDRYRSTKGATEDSIRASLSKNLTDTLDGRIGYSYARREADHYDAFISYSTLISSLSCPSLVTVDPDPDTGGTTTVDTCFNNHPDIRQFDLASRDRDMLSASLMYIPSAAIDIGLDIAGRRDVYDDDINFDDTYLGLTADDSLSVTVDVGYAPAGLWSINAYLTRERIESSQSGRAYGGTAASAIDSSLNWGADFDDVIDTVGITGSLDLLYETIRLTMTYAYTRESSRIRFASGSGLTYEDMPEDKSKRHALDIDAVYKISDSIGVGLGVGYEKFESHDWSLDSVAAGGSVLNDVLLLSGPEEDYTAYLVTATMIYTW
jgi:MtrB/PioB family decaheme-associated outer membrane protein